jgi:hypothetical protein
LVEKIIQAYSSTGRNSPFLDVISDCAGYFAVILLFALFQQTAPYVEWKERANDIKLLFTSNSKYSTVHVPLAVHGPCYI